MLCLDKGREGFIFLTSNEIGTIEGKQHQNADLYEYIGMIKEIQWEIRRKGFLIVTKQGFSRTAAKEKILVGL